MKPRLLALLAFVCAATCLLPATPARAVPFDNNPKILLHLNSVTTKNACSRVPADCRDVVTEGSTVGGTYYVYLLAARGSMANVGGFQLGLHYQNGCPSAINDESGIDIFSWTLCATLEFTTPSPSWPKPGSGNLITWDVVHACQTGESAVAGYFYMGWYGQDDVLRVIPRPVDATAKVANCGSIEVPIPTSSLGNIAFSAGGATPGCNPCDGPCSVPGNLPGCVPLPDTTPPQSVSDLTVLSTDGVSATLRWTNTGDDGTIGQASGTDLRYSLAPITEANFNFAIGVFPATVPGAPGTQQQRIVNGLAGNTTYYFAMKVRDEVPNISGLSNVASGTTGSPPPPDVTPPAAITNLQVVGQSGSTLVISWNAPGDDGNTGGAAALYTIRRSTSPITAGNFASATPVTPAPPSPGTPGFAQTMSITGLLPTTTYYIAMTTSDEVPNTSSLSNVASGTTNTLPADTTPPAAVNNLTVVSATFLGVSLRWNAPGDDGNTGTATSYDVRYSQVPITALNFNSATPALNEPAPLVAGSVQNFNVPGLSPNVTWFFALKTADEIPNQSGISNVVNATVPSAPPEANERTSLLLHLASPQPSACSAPASLDCRDAVTRGDLLPANYHVYLLAGQFAEIGGIECGITYDDGQPGGLDDHDQVDVYSWTLCADLQFSSSEPAWPAPGSGTLLTWTQANCRTPPTAVAGYFYVGAYSPDEMRLTARPASGAAKVATCSSAETVLQAEALGTAVFSAGASVDGYNPCDRGTPNPVFPTSWSRIKLLTGQAAPAKVSRN